MSMHLVDCAAVTKGLEPSWKLLLMSICDSADKSTHIGLPGEKTMLAWSGLSRGRMYEVLTILQELDLLQKHRAGGNGHRAEWVVFPRGCCKHHPRATDDDDDLASGGSDTDVEATGQVVVSGGPNTTGSGEPDPVSVAVSGPPDPDPGDTPTGSDQPDPTAAAVSDQGPVGRTPSLASSVVTGGGSLTGPTRASAPLPAPDPTEPTPPAGPADRDAHGPTNPHCRDHPGGTTAACGGCGNRRAAFERAERSRAAVRRAADQDAATQAARREKAAAAAAEVRATRAAEARADILRRRELAAAAQGGGA